MRDKPVTVVFSKDTIRKLDKLAKDREMTRAALIRRIVKSFVEKD
ncbi:MAG: CopG family transcriptional regulator [Opitutae bacterium]